METDAQRAIQEETDGLNDGTKDTAPDTRPKGTKPAPVGNTSKQKSTTKRTEQSALQKEQRKAAAAQAAVEDLQRRLAAVEEALAEERQKAAEAQGALAEQKRAAETQPETQERTAEQMPGGEAAFGLMPFVGFRGTDLFNVSQQIAEQAIKQPPSVLKQYTNFMLEMGRVMTGQSTVEPDARDKRFLDEMWKTNLMYHMYLQTYLTWEKSLNAFIDDADLDKKDADRARFVLSLYADTVAPTNTLLGNPAAMKKMYETGGASLVQGLTHMLGDLANNGGLPAQVDRSAFQVGKNLALTPGAVVFKNDVLELLQYTPTTERVFSHPLLIIASPVNKFYLADLAPGKSLVEYLVGNGIQTFLVSWRNPTPHYREWGFDTYTQALLAGIDAVCAITESEDINIMALCMGGVLFAQLLGYLVAGGDRRIHAVTFPVTVLDSSIETTMGLFATKETIEAAKQTVRLKGVVEGQEMARSFAWLRPNDLIWNYWVNNYLIGNDPAAVDIMYWNCDTTRLPARLLCEMLDLNESNALTHAGMHKVFGTPIDLSKVINDAYIISGLTDHITPWQACYATTQLLGGKFRFILSHGGHLIAILSPPNSPKAKYYVGERYPADPQQWLANAELRSGSWWEDWRDWLSQRSGEQRLAPQQLGNAAVSPRNTGSRHLRA